MRYIVVAIIVLVSPIDGYGEEVSGAGLPGAWNGSWKGACSTTYTDGRNPKKPAVENPAFQMWIPSSTCPFNADY